MQCHEAKQLPDYPNVMKSIPRHGVLNLTRVQDKE